MRYRPPAHVIGEGTAVANLIYIGNLAAMDIDESNTTNENPGAVQGDLFGR